MRKRIKNRFDSVPVKPEENVVANGAQATIPITPQVDEKSQLEQLNILYSFLENRYAKKVSSDDRRRSNSVFTLIASIRYRNVLRSPPRVLPITTI